MATNHRKAKGRSETPGGFAGIPRCVMDHPDYINLTAGAVKLLLELARQYRGKNNGDLTTAYSVLSGRGFTSKTTIKRCIDELVEANLIVQTRLGKFQNPGGVPALYALSWRPINECVGKKLEVDPTSTPPRKFSLEKLQPGPETGQGENASLAKKRKRNARGEFVMETKILVQKLD